MQKLQREEEIGEKPKKIAKLFVLHANSLNKFLISCPKRYLYLISENWPKEILQFFQANYNQRFRKGVPNV